MVNKRPDPPHIFDRPIREQLDRSMDLLRRLQPPSTFLGVRHHEPPALPQVETTRPTWVDAFAATTQPGSANPAADRQDTAHRMESEPTATKPKDVTRDAGS